ncbi:MAG: hypothetical protein LBP62_02235 [Clostridiales bacterium]|nr:hypothetical protein [Clostridiales bacterium]
MRNLRKFFVVLFRLAPLAFYVSFVAAPPLHPSRGGEFEEVFRCFV